MIELGSIAQVRAHLNAGLSAEHLRAAAVGVAQERVPSAIESVVSRAVHVPSVGGPGPQAGSPPRPLEGVPFAVKANIDVAGVVTTSGLNCPPSGWWPPAERDASAVTRLVAAGAVPVLTTTMAPMAMGSVTVSPSHGPCLNPLDSRCHAGGSSGGSGAVVGAGAVPFALGTDTLGSVRIPAAYCGVTGWIPTPGSIDVTGMVPLCGELDRLGVLCADPRDLRVLIDVLMAGQRLQPAQGGLVACIVGIDAAVDDAAMAAVYRAIEVLERAGTRFSTPQRLDIEPARLRRRGFLLAEAQASVTFADALARGAVPASMEGLLAYGAAASPDALARSRQAMAQARRAADVHLAASDVLVLPTTPHGAPLIADDPDDAADLTAWVNAAGLPAVTVPAGGRSVQLVGRPGSDLTLAALAVSVWLGCEPGLTSLEEG